MLLTTPRFLSVAAAVGALALAVVAPSGCASIPEPRNLRPRTVIVYIDGGSYDVRSKSRLDGGYIGVGISVQFDLTYCDERSKKARERHGC